MEGSFLVRIITRYSKNSESNITLGTIETSFDLANDLTIIKVVGKVQPRDFHEWTANYYAGKVTALNLWDLSEADLSAIKTEDLIEDTQRSKKVADLRRGGKTAVVSPGNTLEFGVSRMRESFAEMEEMPFKFRTFRSVDDAKEWLGIGCLDLTV